jgi:phosphoglycerate dehydrogenase-like enzyme
VTAITVLVPDEHGMHALSSVHEVRAVLYGLDRPLPPEAPEARALVAGFVPAAKVASLFPRLPRLQLVQTLSAGVEEWAGLLPAGLLLSNARGAHGGATAEWAAAALLAIYRELPEFGAAQREHRWAPHDTDTLDGKRVLIVGAGDLAAELARRLEPFGAEISLVGRRARPGVHPVHDLPELLPRHDAVVLMVPLTSATRRMVDAAFLAAIPDGAVLVNAARGGLVDTEALLAELRTGRLRAALDVTDPEPLPEDHPLWEAPGVLLTPHAAGDTYGAHERAWSVAARQIAQFADRGEPDNVVTPDH